MIGLDRGAPPRDLGSAPLRPTSAAGSAPESIIAMQARAAALSAILSDYDRSEAEYDAAYDERAALLDAALALPVASLPGALATLIWARDEFAIDAVDTDPSNVWMLAMLDKALSALRAAVEGGARG